MAGKGAILCIAFLFRLTVKTEKREKALEKHPDFPLLLLFGCCCCAAVVAPLLPHFFAHFFSSPSFPTFTRETNFAAWAVKEKGRKKERLFPPALFRSIRNSVSFLPLSIADLRQREGEEIGISLLYLFPVEIFEVSTRHNVKNGERKRGLLKDSLLRQPFKLGNFKRKSTKVTRVEGGRKIEFAAMVSGGGGDTAHALGTKCQF